YLFRDEGRRYAAGMIDLKTASRDALIRLIVSQHEMIARQERVIAAQQERIAALETTVAQLTAQVGELLATVEALRRGDDGAESGRPQGMPGLKPATAQPRPSKQPRKRRMQQFVRRRMEPTQRVVHAVEACPTCGMPLVGGAVKRTREVIEGPLVPAVITEHVYLERCCPRCHTRHTPAVALTGEVLGRQRFGAGLVSLIATLRAEARLPVATIQWYLQTFHALSVSGGAIVGALRQVARAGEPAVAAIREEIRGSPAAHGDETGWREDGVNGYAWVFCTPTAQYFTRGSRSGAMVDAVLGDTFAGVLVSDFYAGYAHYPGVKQKCWAHLLRDVHDLRVAHVENAEVQAWAAAVHDVYLRAVAWKEWHTAAGEAVRQQAETTFMQALQRIIAPYIEARVPQRVLSQRMAKHLHELFVFVREPAVPPDNNEAERALRHLVTSRKISGGTRSTAGSATKMTLATLFGTWRRKGINPFRACRALLISP
ncbi:MAG: IS66 family transposase, partial [Chloroflexota bacterium]|nr:IS66 family transposase [Chloroflexota bacterium]